MLYPTYKPSGIEWLGETPEHWAVLRLATVCSKITNGYVGPTRDILVSDGVRYLQSLHIKRNQIQFDGKYFVKDSWSRLHAKSILREGDVLVVQTGDIGQVAVVPKEFEGSNCHALIILSCRPDHALGQFISLVLNSDYGFHSLNRIQTGALHPHLNCTFVREIHVPLPPLNEQHTITAYLDRETTQIDALIEKKQKQIELLQEKRTALISHAVTKGLNPNVKMKDSGVEWLGPVPEGWSISKLGFHASVKARLGWKGLKADEYVDEGFIFLSTPNIKNRCIDFDDVNYITKKRYLESPEIMLEVGDVLIAKDGSTLGTTNVVRNLPAPATVNSSIAVLRPKPNLNSSFLYWIMVCHYIQNIIQRVKDGQGVPHLFQADLRKFWIWLPSDEEQRAISAFLNRETARIDALIKKVEKSIILLREYRTSLISAAVTGKIDVRKEAA